MFTFYVVSAQQDSGYSTKNPLVALKAHASGEFVHPKSNLKKKATLHKADYLVKPPSRFA